MPSHRHAVVDPEWRTVRAAAPSRAGAAESRGARLTFLGHSTVLIEVDELRILTDPILRGGLGPVRRQVAAVLPELFEDLDAIFISHGHHDHLDPVSLRRIPGRPTLLVPRGFGAMARRTGLGPVEEVEPGDRLIIDRVHFAVVRAEHSGRREPFGPEGPAIGCVVAGSVTVYFPGDTDLFPEMAQLAGHLDVALLPVWGWGPTIGAGHMDPERAAQAAAVLRPRLAVPIHWGTLYPAGLRGLLARPFESPGPVFAEAAARLAPDVEVRVLRPLESLDIPPRHVPDDAAWARFPGGPQGEGSADTAGERAADTPAEGHGDAPG